MDLAFLFWATCSITTIINFPIDAPVTDTMENSPLIAKLLEVPEYKELYHQHLEELVEGYLNSGVSMKTPSTRWMP